MEAQELTKAYITLPFAEGSIEADESQQERLEEFTDRIANGEFHVEIEGTVVCGCVDGRCAAESEPLCPNAAGGSETIMVADDLTAKRFSFGTDGSTLAQYKALLDFLHDAKQPIGGHTAEGVSAPASGCGANDKLADIYSFIDRHGNDIRDALESDAVGMKIDDLTHVLITGNAKARTSFSAGGDLLEALANQPEARVSNLQGAHREVVAVLNMRRGTTLDREALKREFPDHQAFNVDVGAFEDSAKLLTDDPAETTRLVTAMAYYNTATACVLGGTKLRIVVVK